ncbi:MAG: pyridoxal-phosphate-dependent aminotransferase family protein [Candidatus Syntropharchaeia archaeon]
MDIYEEKELILLPGPVPVAPRILRSMAKPMINHRGREFKELYTGIQEILKEVFQTENDIFVLSGSGTCAMETAIANLIDGDGIVSVMNGKFGDRFGEIAERYGKVRRVSFEWGESIDPERVEEAIDEETKAICMVHNETSTGILNPAREIGEIAKKHDLIFIVDGITSIGGENFPVDEWNVDIAVVGSQKCLGAPPGLSAISVSERVWDMLVEKPPYYMDLRSYKKSSEKGQTPYTPAIPLFFALEEALKIIKEEGLQNRIERHRRYSEAVRSAVKEMGLSLFPKLNEFSRYSPTVTAVDMPGGLTDEEFKREMRKRGVVPAGGQEKLKGRIFRIGTMGNITPKDVLTAIQALEHLLLEKGITKEFGRGLVAAGRILSG